MPKLTLQVKITSTILFTFLSLWAFAQNISENNIHEKNGKVYFEILVQQAEVESIINSTDYCEAGTSISFCFRNYVNEKLDLSVNGGADLEFTIEASLSNTKEIQINLSADTGETTINSYEITNNLFFEGAPTFMHEMKFTLNGVEQEIVLDTNNRTAIIQ